LCGAAGEGVVGRLNEANDSMMSSVVGLSGGSDADRVWSIFSVVNGTFGRQEPAVVEFENCPSS
jgi:hypothetical protein